MRVPTQERRPFRIRGWMIGIVIALVVLLFSLRGLAGIYTDFLWFDSLDQGDTWSGLLGAKIVPALVFTVLFFLILLVNLLIADRIAPKMRAMGPSTPEDEMVSRYQQATAPYQGRLRVAVAIFFALVAGVGVGSQWQEWILFTHRQDFGIQDPQFQKDVGFYIFELPFLQFIIDWLFAGLVIVLLVTALVHWLNGGIRFQSTVQHVTPQVKAHLSVILAVMALVKTADYYYGRYALTLSDRGVVDGATYTDVNAQLPALEFLVAVSVIGAVLFLWNIRRRGWVLPIIAVGLWAFVSLVVGTIYPTAIQNLKVNPNEYASEEPYIARNIRATRSAFNLGDVRTADFAASNLEPEVVQTNLTTVDNVRVWDPDVIEATYQTRQGFQTYYVINDVDVDRYDVDGQTVPVVVAARNLNSSELPSQSWVNEHIVYTHGYGAIASPANTSAGSGNPDFLLSEIPTDANGIELEGRGAEIYFGEGLGNYVIVNGEQDEFNYARQGSAVDSQTRYRGADGVELSNIFKQAAFALRFGDFNPLISGQVTNESKVLMLRDVRERVRTLAPFLDFDANPYPIVVDDRVLWVLDGYTTSNRYPYSQVAEGTGGIGANVNYVRNSVKVTVDAYDGTAKFYVIDRQDPIIRAYVEAFPDLFTRGSEMPDLVRAHLRYPEDIFTLQADVFGKYHVREPLRFYRGSERWLLSPDPNVAVQTITNARSGSGAGSGQANPTRTEISATTPRQAPYYQYVRLPGEDRDSFVLMQPFVPVSQDNQQTRLVSFMAAKGDPRNYGEFNAYITPQNETVTGPVQAANDIQTDPEISEQFTLLSRGGSRLVTGHIQLVPIGESIVYVQPIYVRKSGTQGFPQIRFVAVSTSDRAVLASTVEEGLNELLGVASPTTPTEPEGPTGPDTGEETATIEELLDEAAQKFADAEAALTAGDLGRYQQLVGEAQDLVDRALDLARAATSGSTTTTTSRPTNEPAKVG